MGLLNHVQPFMKIIKLVGVLILAQEISLFSDQFIKVPLFFPVNEDLIF